MKIRLAALVVLGGLIFVTQVLAYSPLYTHPDLTEEMAKLFNLKKSDLKITGEEIKWLRTGAINEDDAPRWINHFYNPVNKVGWSGKHFSTLTPEEALKFGADFAPKPPMASVDWVVSQESQALYGDTQGNQTWQKAVKSFIDGDKKSAFIALGHVLHLLEDASVPDHTRDDTHADLFGDPGSPYEKYTKNYTNSNKLNLAENLKNTSFFNFANIQEAIKSLAIYSNNNFFSEDTISNSEFTRPLFSSLEKRTVFIDDKEKKILFDANNQIYLAIENKSDTFTLDDKMFVLPSYRDHLFPKAVLTGASVINLFFKDVEYYKQHPDQLEPIVPDSHEPLALAIKHSPKKIAIKIADTASRISADVSKITSRTQLAINGLLGSVGIKIASNNNQVSSQINNELNPQPTTPNSPSELVNPPVTIATAQTPKPPAPAPKPTPAPVTVEEVAPLTPQPIVEQTLVPEVVLPPPAPVAPKPSYILAIGYVPPASPAPAAATEENSAVLTDASSIIATSTTDTTTSTESVATSTLSATTTVDISTTTVATTTPETVTSTPEISTSTISVTTTIDTATTTTSTPAVDPAPPEVVINEIAWAGTASNRADDEWFELFNNTDHEIDLTGWKIYVSGKQVNLTTINNKTIAARGYYLLERKEDSVIRDIGADAIYSLSGGFNNKGEKLELLNPDGVKVDEADASGGWFAGDKYHSMERLDPAKDGNDPTNWQTNINYRPTGINAANAPVYGSPRQSNFGYIMLSGIQEDEVRTLDIKNTPYVVWSYQVPIGKNLNIEAGVDIFLITYGTIEINGSLNAIGAHDKPINFISYPTSTAWANLRFNNSTSTFNFVNLRRGDRITRLPQNLDGMILAKNSNLTINNVLIWDSEANAIGGTDSVFNISNTTIGATVKNDKTYGINTRGGELNLDNVSFTNLFVGLEAGCSDCSHPVLKKKNMYDTNFTNVDFIAEPLISWWNAASSTSP